VAISLKQAEPIPKRSGSPRYNTPEVSAETKKAIDYRTVNTMACMHAHVNYYNLHLAP